MGTPPERYCQLSDHGHQTVSEAILCHLAELLQQLVDHGATATLDEKIEGGNTCLTCQFTGYTRRTINAHYESPAHHAALDAAWLKR